ncbi:16S rRNA (guanine(527)-N(7))-methyltransferase RsmG [Demequina lutea]|uniref:Ribosomal RNA small subunit methyltransferase G n=1 Tax=Demequina lutea TaxID=431489 RepID=A0A7Z0CIR9_9MICO|nr:16S rRNA (guanine(527)-N(7))-methyltransferase RsmG [Demequina lutea]NYI39945.1 16S rRNA (guanine527-N7)-methyltransferase [Demequina lutea]
MTSESTDADDRGTDLASLDQEALRVLLGARFDAVATYAAMLAEQGEKRGLIGPRELERLWERHILNSAAVVPFLGPGRIVDVGSGAGLPGIVIAAMLPDREVVLVEPMERRVAWLEEAATEIGLDNVTVRRARAEEVAGELEADALTARAVASIDKLVKWCLPLLSETGHMALLKGRTAVDEIERAKYVLRKARLSAEVLTAPTLVGLEPTTVVRITRETANR